MRKGNELNKVFNFLYVASATSPAIYAPKLSYLCTRYRH